MKSAVLLALLVPVIVLATPPDDSAPKLPDGTDAARKQMAAFRLPAGMKVELFAAEPKLASPVAIGLDHKGRVYVAEEHRFNAGTEENRTRAFLLEDDLQVQTLDDRLKMFQKWQAKFDGGMDWFTRKADQLRVLEDTTGSGQANQSKILAQFREPLDGLAAGVMAIDGDIYFTCIPHLWVLRKGETKPTKLLSGFGVNAAFLGHDLHGLCRGPDGKLYFSVGDRGFHVTTKEGTTLSGPRTGAVFRCNLDGTELEVVHRGLRNPQELAFDQYGNLFADDNNCDKGDHARLVYVVEGGESGWNMAYQSIAPHTAAPWFAERLWHLQHDGQPAYIVPPVGKIGTGPSGFLFTSGTSLAERYQNSFLMCNYTGNGGLESFKVKPKGAGFEIDDYHDFLKPIMATDAEFGYDGKLYVSDFVNLDWSGKSLGGRIYTVFDPKKLDSDAVRETKELFASGFDSLRTEGVTKENVERWEKLLGHADQRVRQKTQFLLVDLVRSGNEKAKSGATTVLLTTLNHSTNPMARHHAVWGLGQLAKVSLDYLKVTVGFLGFDSDAEVQAQIAKVLGDGGYTAGIPQLIAALGHANARVRFFAAQSLGKLKAKAAVDPLFDVIRQDKDADPFLRHACVVALDRIGDADAVAAKAKDASAAVRLAVVLVQRRWKDPRIATALADPDWFIRTEAARAIHDVPMDDLMPQLAALLPKLGEQPIPDGDALVRRAISAAYRIGGDANAKAVLAVIMNANFSSFARAEALGALRDWAAPPPRDRVTGFWRPLPPRDGNVVRSLFEKNLSSLLQKSDGQLQTAIIETIQTLGVKAEASQFLNWASDEKQNPNLRIAAMRFLANHKTRELDSILTAALSDTSPLIRSEALALIAKTDAKRGSALVAEVLADPKRATFERQRALALLPTLKTPAAETLINDWAKRLSGGTVDPALQLDVQELLQVTPSSSRDAERMKFEQSLANRFQVSLSGGDADRGRELFYNHASAQCARCHTVRGSGGTAGPELTKIAEKYIEKPREHFVESMIAPSAKLAEGYAAISVSLYDGRVIAGTLMKDVKDSISLKDANGKLLSIAKADIESRTKPTSAMPAMDQTLTPREVRDLVEYLTTLK